MNLWGGRGPSPDGWLFYPGTKRTALIGLVLTLQAVEMRTTDVCGLDMSAMNRHRWHPSHTAGLHPPACCPGMCIAPRPRLQCCVCLHVFALHVACPFLKQHTRMFGEAVVCIACLDCSNKSSPACYTHTHAGSGTACTTDLSGATCISKASTPSIVGVSWFCSDVASLCSQGRTGTGSCKGDLGVACRHCCG